MFEGTTPSTGGTVGVPAPATVPKAGTVLDVVGHRLFLECALPISIDALGFVEVSAVRPVQFRTEVLNCACRSFRISLIGTLEVPLPTIPNESLTG
jgi:hypothetical protein